VEGLEGEGVAGCEGVFVEHVVLEEGVRAEPVAASLSRQKRFDC
jgi:hypothetical protein